MNQDFQDPGEVVPLRTAVHPEDHSRAAAAAEAAVVAVMAAAEPPAWHRAPEDN